MISWSDQAKQIKWHESCKCECKSNSTVCNNKQKWKKDKCRCECKRLIHKKCDKKFVWNPSSCKCEYKKKATYSLVRKCGKDIDDKTLSIKEYNKSNNKNLNTSLDSCELYIASSILFLMISVTITGTFVYFCINSHSKKLQTYYY